MAEKPEKIGTTEAIEVKKHSNSLYLPLSQDLCKAYEIKKGDVLRVTIETRVRRSSEED